MPDNSVSVRSARRILGSSADGKTDAEIEVMRDNLENTADILYTQMIEAGRNGLEMQRWLSHFRETGEWE